MSHNLVCYAFLDDSIEHPGATAETEQRGK